MEQKEYFHPNQGVIRCKIDRPEAKSIMAMVGIPSAVVSDCLGKMGVMYSSIKPLAPGMVICGPAITCLSPDYLLRKMAMDLSTKGDVLVIAAGGNIEYSCFGDRTAKKLMLKGLSGVVIDGSTRDASGICKLGFPVFTKGITPRNYHYPYELKHGGVNVDVICGGVLVSPGDLIIGDEDGIVVIPRKQVNIKSPEIVNYYKKEQEKSNSVIKYKPFKVKRELKSLGYKFY